MEMIVIATKSGRCYYINPKAGRLHYHGGPIEGVELTEIPGEITPGEELQVKIFNSNSGLKGLVRIEEVLYIKEVPIERLLDLGIFRPVLSSSSPNFPAGGAR